MRQDKTLRKAYRELKPRLYGKRFNTLLKRKGMSKSRLARESGVALRTLFLWAKGSTLPSERNAIKVLTVLGYFTEDEQKRLFSLFWVYYY